jgi:hypothetical protein
VTDLILLCLSVVFTAATAYHVILTWAFTRATTWLLRSSEANFSGQPDRAREYRARGDRILKRAERFSPWYLKSKKQEN